MVKSKKLAGAVRFALMLAAVHDGKRPPSKAETGNVSAVLDGDIDMFMNAYLKWINS